jgi:hypothetical protein
MRWSEADVSGLLIHPIWPLKMKSTRSPKTSVWSHLTWRNNPDDGRIKKFFRYRQAAFHTGRPYLKVVWLGVHTLETVQVFRWRQFSVMSRLFQTWSTVFTSRQRGTSQEEYTATSLWQLQITFIYTVYRYSRLRRVKQSAAPRRTKLHKLARIITAPPLMFRYFLASTKHRLHPRTSDSSPLTLMAVRYDTGISWCKEVTGQKFILT